MIVRDDKRDRELRDQLQKKFAREINFQRELIGMAKGYAQRTPQERLAGEDHGKFVNPHGWKMPVRFNTASLDSKDKVMTPGTLMEFSEYYTMLLLVCYEHEAKLLGVQTSLEAEPDVPPESEKDQSNAST